MPKFQITAPDGTKYEINGPDGATEQDALKLAQQSHEDTSPTKAKGSVLGGAFMGLRDAVDAGAQLLVRGANKVGLADDAEVNRIDNIVKNANTEYDQSRQLAGRSGIDLARIAGNIANPVNRVIPLSGAATVPALAARGAAQGAISGAATPVLDTENFGSTKLAQTGGGAAVGGIATPAADKLLTSLNGFISKLKPANYSPQQVDEVLSRSAQDAGIDLSQIPQSMLDNVRTQVAVALKQGKTIDAKSALRIADAEQVLGKNAGLTLGQATRDPAQFAKEVNFRGVDGAGAPLVQRFADQNSALIGRVNSLGAANSPGEFQTGEKVISSLASKDATNQAAIRRLYDAAKGLNGGEIPLTRGVTTDAVMQLDQQMRGAFLPGNIRDTLNKITTGEIPFNVSTAEQFKTILGNEIAKAQRAGDGNVITALRTVRQAIDSAVPESSGTTPPSTALGPQPDVLGAFNAARAAARSRFQNIENTPALDAVTSGNAVPDNFFQKFVLNGTKQDLAALKTNTDPQTQMAIRAQLVDYIKSKALNGATDEVGKFSQSAYNKALNSIGDQRLSVFFSPDELASLKQVGRVASYVQNAPAGAAINSSNTAAATMNLLAGLSGKFGSLPGVNALRDSARKFADERAVANALAANLPSQSVSPPVNALRPYLLPFAGALGAGTAQTLQ